MADPLTQVAEMVIEYLDEEAARCYAVAEEHLARGVAYRHQQEYAMRDR